MPRRLVIATRNAGKLAEFARLLEGTAWTPEPLPEGLPPVDEDGATYAENAAKKARAAALATGLPALADDSGIEVDALGGFPGIRSARWTAGDGPAELLLRARELASERRSARMRAAIALVWTHAGASPRRHGSGGRARTASIVALRTYAPQGAERV